MNAPGSKASFYRLTTVFALLLLMVTNAENFLWANESSAVDIDRIRARNKLVVAMFFEDVPPFFMQDHNGKLTGIDPELANDIAQKLGVEVEFNRSAETFDAVVEMVARGEADVGISLLSDTLNRATQVRFSNSYAVLRQTLLINRLQLAQRYPAAQTQAEIRTALNQQEVKIGVIAGTSYVDFVKADYPLASHILYNDFNTMVDDLRDGLIFALLYDELEIMNWRFTNPDGGLHFKTVVLNDRKDTIAIAVNRADEDLLAWLNLYLFKREDDGTLTKLLETYLAKNDWRTQQ